MFVVFSIEPKALCPAGKHFASELYNFLNEVIYINVCSIVIVFFFFLNTGSHVVQPGLDLIT